MTITKLTISTAVKLSANYQSSEASASIEVELQGKEDRDEVFTKGAAWLRATCLREARAGLQAVTNAPAQLNGA